jgi:hypothetical protein
MSFAADLERGLEIERKVLKIIHKKYPQAHIVTALKEWDIWIPEIEIGIEVKYDPMSCQTGNIVIEYEMNGKSSALMTTEAKWWIFYDGEVMFSITPKQIIQVIFDKRMTFQIIRGIGDMYAKKVFLVPKAWLLEKAKILQDNRFKAFLKQ